jgi:hypothetical protein
MEVGPFVAMGDPNTKGESLGAVHGAINAVRYLTTSSSSMGSVEAGLVIRISTLIFSVTPY